MMTLRSIYFAWKLSDLKILSKDDFAFYFAWKSRIEEEEEKEKGDGNGNEQDTVSPDMRILSMILDLMLMTIKMETQSRKDNIVKSNEILNMDMIMHENRRWR